MNHQNLIKSLFSIVLFLSLTSCFQNEGVPKPNSTEADFFHSNYYDENNKLYQLNWFQKMSLKSVIMKEDSRKSNTETFECHGTRMIGKTPIGFTGSQQVTKTIVQGKFGKEYKEDGKFVYLDVFSGTTTYTDRTECKDPDDPW